MPVALRATQARARTDHEGRSDRLRIHRGGEKGLARRAVADAAPPLVGGGVVDGDVDAVKSVRTRLHPRQVDEVRSRHGRVRNQEGIHGGIRFVIDVNHDAGDRRSELQIHTSRRDGDIGGGDVGAGVDTSICRTRVGTASVGSVRSASIGAATGHGVGHVRQGADDADLATVRREADVTGLRVLAVAAVGTVRSVGPIRSVRAVCTRANASERTVRAEDDHATRGRIGGD